MKTFVVAIFVLWSAPALAGLNDVAQPRGLSYGCAFGQGEVTGDPQFKAAVVAECGTWVATHGMEYDTIARLNTAPIVRNWDFGEFDWYRQMATAYGKQLRLTNLTWNAKPPPAFILAMSQWDVLVHLTDYAFWVALHGLYGANPITSIDVVNEPMEGGAWTDKLGLNVWSMGAFWGARWACDTAGIKCELVANEFNLENGDTWKQARFLRYIDDLKAQGIPITAVGIEGHIWSDWCFSNTLGAFIDRVHARGLDVIVTELTVKGTDDRQVADAYGRFVDTCLRHGARKIITWGLSDKYRNPKMFGPADRPMLLDSAMNKKPAYNMVSDLFLGCRLSISALYGWR